jgi:hypothetical protein
VGRGITQNIGSLRQGLKALHCSSRAVSQLPPQLLLQFDGCVSLSRAAALKDSGETDERGREEERKRGREGERERGREGERKSGREGERKGRRRDLQGSKVMEEAHGPWRRELLLAAHVCEHVDRGRVSRKCSSASTSASTSAVVVVLVLPGSLAQKSEGRGEQEASDSQNMTHRTCCEKSLNRPLASSPNTCIVRLPLHQRLLACGRQRQGGEEGEREKSGEQRDKRRVRSTVTSRLTTLDKRKRWRDHAHGERVQTDRDRS